MGFEDLHFEVQSDRPRRRSDTSSGTAQDGSTTSLSAGFFTMTTSTSLLTLRFPECPDGKLRATHDSFIGPENPRLEREGK